MREKVETYSGEGDDESSEIMLDVESFHHSSVNLFDHSGSITRDVSVIGEGVQSR